jgi:hypothetical protein
MPTTRNDPKFIGQCYRYRIFYRKLVKISIKIGGVGLIKKFDDNLRTQTKHF